MKKYVSVLLLLMFGLLCGCGQKNSLAADLESAQKEVEKNKEQEEKIAGFISEVVGEEVDVSALSELSDTLKGEAEESSSDEKKEQKSEKKSKGIDFGKYLSGDYAEMMQEMHYYMEYSSYVWGMEGSGKTAVDGQNTDIITEMMGMSTRSLLLDGYQYEFDAANKKYTKTEAGDSEELLASMGVDYSKLEYVGSGSGEIPGMEEVADYDGGTYEYDEFQIMVDFSGMSTETTGNGEMAIPVRFYMDGSELYAVYTQAMGIDSVMIIHEMSEKIPDDMLCVPEDYELVDSLYTY